MPTSDLNRSPGRTKSPPLNLIGNTRRDIMTAVLNKRPNEVFTPRQAEVNMDMYVHRPDHEKKLRRWLDEAMHGFIFGESGSGKTWLYKSFFALHRVNYKVANCALASSKGSLRNEIFSACCPDLKSIKTGYTESKDASINLMGVLNGGLGHEGVYELIQDDLLITSFQKLQQESIGWGRSVIVLDNVEAIFSNETIMDELAEIIILLDDERYSRFDVKFLIVGVPCGVIEYFSKSKNRSSVSNRITELPAVFGFTLEETKQVVRKGFNELLGAKFGDLTIKGLAGRVHDITLGVPQRVHEYCLSLAYECEEDNYTSISKSMLNNANIDWLTKGLRESYSVIEQHFSGGKGQIRRKQVLYIIGQYKGHQFSTSEIGLMLKSEFPSEAPESDSGVGSILSSLAKGNSPILVRNEINGSYTFRDPRHIMCLRIILSKTHDNSIAKLPFIRN